MIYDSEDVLRALRIFLKDRLNDQIAIINARKGDFEIDLIPERDDRFVFGQGILDEPNGAYVAVFQQPTIEHKSNANDSAFVVEVFVEVVIDDNKSENDYWISHRYMTALYEIIREFEATTQEVEGMNITEVHPMLLEGRERQQVVSGVTASIAIG